MWLSAEVAAAFKKTCVFQGHQFIGAVSALCSSRFSIFSACLLVFAPLPSLLWFSGRVSLSAVLAVPALAVLWLPHLMHSEIIWRERRRWVAILRTPKPPRGPLLLCCRGAGRAVPVSSALNCSQQDFLENAVARRYLLWPPSGVPFGERFSCAYK